MIIIPTKWLFHWEYTPFSDKPTWSKEFLHSDVALPLPLDGLEPAENGHGRWAQPSREQLRRLMRYLQQHPREGKAIGEALVGGDGMILLGFDFLCYRQIRVDVWWFWVLSWIFYDFTLGSGWKGNGDAEKMVEWWITLRDWDLWMLGDPPGKKEPSLRKKCFSFGCFGQSMWSEFPMFRTCSCSPSNTAPLPQSQMQAARQRMVERFSPEKVVSQHILPLLQRWHRGPGWQRSWDVMGLYGSKNPCHL